MFSKFTSWQAYVFLIVWLLRNFILSLCRVTQVKSIRRQISVLVYKRIGTYIFCSQKRFGVRTVMINITMVQILFWQLLIYKTI